MSLYVSAGSSNISPIEPGSYPAICYGLIDLGEQYSETYDKWTAKVLLMWEIPGEKIDLGGDEPVSRTITKSYSCSLNEKATLRKDLAAWRGRDFTQEELRKFDLRTIVGAPCLLNIIHRENNNRTYADISAIMKMPKGMFTEPHTLPRIIFDLDEDSLEVIEALPEWVQNRIKESRTYKERVFGKKVTPVDEMDDIGVGGPEDEEEVPF